MIVEKREVEALSARLDDGIAMDRRSRHVVHRNSAAVGREDFAAVRHESFSDPATSPFAAEGDSLKRQGVSVGRRLSLDEVEPSARVWQKSQRSLILR